MASRRADLSILPHPPLPAPRTHRGLLDASQASEAAAEYSGASPALQRGLTAHGEAPARAVDEEFPSLGTAKKELMVQQSFRIPLSQVQSLEKMKTDGTANPSAFVRDCIARGLRDVQKRGKRR